MRMTREQYLIHLAKRGETPKPGPSKAKQREAEIQQEIADYLRLFGHECYFHNPRFDVPTTCAAGTPDFIGWIRGVPFAMEVKRPGGKKTGKQTEHLGHAGLAGGRAVTVHSLAEAVEFITGRVLKS